MTKTSELVDSDSGSNKKDLNRTILNLRNQKNVIVGKMRMMEKKLNNDDGNTVLLDQYQKLNDKLRENKVYEAELVHKYNML